METPICCCILIHQPPFKALGFCQTHRVGPVISQRQGTWILLLDSDPPPLESRSGVSSKKYPRQGKRVTWFHGNHNPWWFSWWSIHLFLMKEIYNLSRLFVSLWKSGKLLSSFLKRICPFFGFLHLLDFSPSVETRPDQNRLQWCANLECQRLPRSRFRR